MISGKTTIMILKIYFLYCGQSLLYPDGNFIVFKIKIIENRGKKKERGYIYGEMRKQKEQEREERRFWSLAWFLCEYIYMQQSTPHIISSKGEWTTL